VDYLEKSIAEVCETEHKAVDDGTEASLLKSMKLSGVSLSVALPVATKPNQSKGINEFAYNINQKHKNIISFGAVHPLQPDWERELERLAALGFKGIKLHPEGQQTFIDSKEYINIINKAYDLNMLVVLHTGRDWGFYPPVHCSPERFKSALDYFDGSNVIAAHLGGFEMWDDVFKYLTGTNIYMDTAMVLREIDKELFMDILKAHTADKILYGSDIPWDRQDTNYEYLIKWNVPDTDKICFKNAERLLNIKTAL